MSGRQRWQAARDAAQRIGHRVRDRELLLRLAQLPFAPDALLEQFAGVQRRSLYPTVARLIDSGLVASVAPPLTADHSPRLLYLTDLGVATMALLYGVEPRPFAQQMGITRQQLLRRIPGLPALQDAYRLLGALAAAMPGPCVLRGWEWPWRRSYLRPPSRTPGWVKLPAFAALSWDSLHLLCLLVPDRGQVPLRAFRLTLAHLLRLRAIQGVDLPVIIIATTAGRRAQAWDAVLRAVAASQGDAPLAALIITWDKLTERLEDVSALSRLADLSDDRQGVPPCGLPHLKPRPWGSSLPGIVGGPIGTAEKALQAEEHLAQVALKLSRTDRELLELVGQHPFLSCTQLARLRRREARALRWQRSRLVTLGLLRVVRAEEVPQRASTRNGGLPTDTLRQLELTELTEQGLALVAGEWGLSVRSALRLHALVGGGPAESFGARSDLLKHIAHTVEANDIVIELLLAAVQLLQLEAASAVAVWRSAAACARGALRPDGYAMVDCGAKSFGFFLEYDRGTEHARDYRRKFNAYYRYQETRRFARDYDGFPTILVVTNGPGPEERMSKTIRSISAGREPVLPVLLTTLGWIRGQPQGLLGPIWRDPWDAHRRSWLGVHCDSNLPDRRSA